jgi:hypothetical protein
MIALSPSCRICVSSTVYPFSRSPFKYASSTFRSDVLEQRLIFSEGNLEAEVSNLTRPVDPSNLGDVMRKIAQEEAQKAVHESQVPFLNLQERVLGLENKVRELERRAHDHPITQ